MGVKCRTIGNVSRTGGKTAEARLMIFLLPHPSQANASDMSVRDIPRRDTGYSQSGLPSVNSPISSRTMRTTKTVGTMMAEIPSRMWGSVLSPKYGSHFNARAMMAINMPATNGTIHLRRVTYSGASIRGDQFSMRYARIAVAASASPDTRLSTWAERPILS